MRVRVRVRMHARVYAHVQGMGLAWGKESFEMILLGPLAKEEKRWA